MIPFGAVEFLGYWLGGGTAAQLGDMLGVTREHAQRAVLGPYRKQHPGVLSAKRGSGFRLMGDEYNLRYAPYKVASFLDLLRGLAAAAEGHGRDWFLAEQFLTTSLLIDSGSKAEQMQGLMKACVHQHSVDLDYVSKRRVSRIHFSPHALVVCANRPHFRGFAVGGDYKRYIDIVPSRVRFLQATDHKDYVGSAEDREWHECVDLEFVVCPDLPESIRNSIIEENDGSEHLQIRQVRHAVKMYVCREIEWRFVRDRVIHAWRLKQSSSL